MIVVLALAGGLGAAARFVVDTAVQRRVRSAVPLGTFVVNVTACLLLGLLAGWAVGRPDRDALVAVLGVGFLGGYSTFSTASVEAAALLADGRPLRAVLHPLAMLLTCVAAAAAGVLLTSA